MKVTVYDKKGVKKEDIDIKSDIFKISGKESLISEVIVSYLSNMRLAQPKTKKRGEVSGGGRKPWRQKGTGRARTGSNRNPLWRGGGNIFGPTGIENHEKALPKTKRRAALRAALSAKASDIIVVEKIDLKEAKTKEAANILKNLPIQGKAFFVLGEGEDLELQRKAFGNIQKISFCFYKNLNAYDVLNAGQLVFIGSGLEDTVKFLEK